jgi:trehalose 6-phosphate phosphatase
LRLAVFVRPQLSGRSCVRGMRDILSRRHIQKLRDFAASNVLLAFDYDGTLAPIVPNPSVAPMRSTTRRLLTSVARRYPCVVISGRVRRDLMKRVGPIPLFHLAGNHGMEPWAEHPTYVARVQQWVRRLSDSLASHAGVTVEDKKYSVTIHYRHARHRRKALAAIKRAVGVLRGGRALGGRDAISVVPREAPTKGAALERARRLLACDTAIYVGDDETDEDAFVAAGPDRLLAIRIGGGRTSGARYRLKTQHEIDAFLEALLAFRPINASRSDRG